MAERRIEHVFECSPETYWEEIFFSPEFNRALFVERLRFERWEVTATEPSAHGFRRTVEAVPPALNLPGPLKKLMHKGTGYREEGEYDKAASRYRLRATSHSMPEKLDVTGEISVEARGEGKCARVYLAKVKARVFAVGGLLEERVLSDLERSLNKAAEFTSKWLAERSS